MQLLVLIVSAGMFDIFSKGKLSLKMYGIL